MRPIKKLMLAYFALGAFTASTVAIGIFARFADDGHLVQGWILPLCLATAAGATLVGSIEKRALRLRARNRGPVPRPSA